MDWPSTARCRAHMPRPAPARRQRVSGSHGSVQEKELTKMKAAVFRGPGVVEVGERLDPVIEAPTDAVVRVVLACVCGSDLWYFRGESLHAVGSIGHEFIGVVEQIGADVDRLS